MMMQPTMTRRALTRRALFTGVALGMAHGTMIRRVMAQDASPVPGGSDPLPSWADGPLKQRVLDFVTESVTEGQPFYLPPSQRIATFDNDGTLLCEYPAPAQAYFAVDLARQIAETDDEAARAPLFKDVLSGALDDVANNPPSGYYPLFDAINGNMTQQRYIAICRSWLQKAVHPVTGMRFVDMVYQPQLELLALLRANGFITFVVTGSSVDFIRAFAPVVYDTPNWSVIGTSYDYEFAVAGGKGQVMGSEVEDTVVVASNKATAIALQVGERPVIAVGNSDGDYEMLQYANGGPTPALTMLVHHTDAEREFAYDRDYEWSPLVNALAAAPAEGFAVIDMKNDWLRIWPETPSPSLLAGGS
jgi:phosphoserine phosphatase